MRLYRLLLLPSLLIYVLITTSCQEELSKRVFQVIKLHPSLQYVLKSNPDDSYYYKAACFIIANTPEKERDLLDCDSLIRSIHTSIEIWRKVPWHSNYSQTDFLEYILPYRVANEPLEYYWKWDYPQKLNLKITDKTKLRIFAQEINSKVHINISTEKMGKVVQGFTTSLQGSYGKCDDRAVLTTMAMRSYGIPSAFECIPYWGNSNSGHSFCSVIEPNNNLLIFQSPTDTGEKRYFTHKIPKIYRQMYSLQTDSPLYKYRESESIPPFFSNFHQKDVTSIHTIKTRNIAINIQDKKHKIAYLSVFSPYGWLPIAYAENKQGKVIFTNIGTGSENHHDNFYFDTKQTKSGILYLPSLYVNNQVKPIGAPIIISDNQITEIIINPTITENVTLYRKYPLSKRITNFASDMQGGVFEGANRKDFADAIELYYINNTPLTHMQKVPVTLTKKFKYLRYRKSNGTFSLSEIKAYNSSNEIIPGELINCKALNELPEINNLADNDCLSYFTLPQSINLWVGIVFNRPEIISSIGFCPRTDDNDISPGDQYELFYWHNEWHSLGTKKATDYKLTFNNVPLGALLWLRDLTKGREERPFTIHKGVQIWW